MEWFKAARICWPMHAGMVLLLACCCVESTAQVSNADRYAGWLSAGSGNVFRGLKRHDKSISLQGEMRVRFGEEFFGGVYLSQAEYGFRTPKDETEFDYYVGWSRQLGRDYALQVRFQRYTYPGSSDRFVEYDYNEILVGLDLPSNLSVSLSLSDAGLAFAGGDAYAQMLWFTPVFADMDFSVALGAVRELDSDYDGYAYWDAGVSAPLGRFVVDLRYHDTARSARWFGRAPATGLWVASVTLAW